MRCCRRLSVIAVLLLVAHVSCWGGLSSYLPLGREWAGDRELPKPLGGGLTVHYQEQGYQISTLSVDLAVPAPLIDLNALLQTSELDIENEVYEVNLAFDAWVLPFFNVFGLLGYIDGETTVDVSVPPENIQLNIEYSGIMYGVGCVLAGGWDPFFGTLTAAITETDLDVSTSSVKAWMVSPKAGINTGIGAFWLGVMYQEAEEEHTGEATVTMFGNTLPVSYDATLEQDEPWNYVAGFSTVLGECLEVSIEGGLGDRKQATVTTKFRF